MLPYLKFDSSSQHWFKVYHMIIVLEEIFNYNWLKSFIRLSVFLLLEDGN